MIMSTKSPSQSRLSCQSCQKGFPYNKRLVDHVKKKEECQQFYTENQLEMPVPSGVKRKNQHDMPVIEKPPSVKRKRTSDTDQSEPSITLTDQSNTDEIEAVDDQQMEMDWKKSVTVAEIYERDCNEDENNDDSRRLSDTERGGISKKKYSIEFKMKAIDDIERNKGSDDDEEAIQKVSRDLEVSKFLLSKWWTNKNKIKTVYQLNIRKSKMEHKIELDVERKDETVFSSPVLVKGKKKTRVYCKTCPGCLTPDCGLCRNCLDKPKFGGPNKIRQRCDKKTCQKKEEKQRLRQITESPSEKDQESVPVPAEEATDANDSPIVDDMEPETRVNTEILHHSHVATNTEVEEALENHERPDNVPKLPKSDENSTSEEEHRDSDIIHHPGNESGSDPQLERKGSEQHHKMTSQHELEVDEDIIVEQGQQENKDSIDNEQENVSVLIDSAQTDEMLLSEKKFSENIETESDHRSNIASLKKEGISRNNEVFLDEKQNVSSVVPVIGSGKKKNPSCKTCPGCVAPDCGVCKFCLDKPRLGGSGKMRQRCIEKACHMKMKYVRPGKSLSSKGKDPKKPLDFNVKTKSEPLDTNVPIKLKTSEEKYKATNLAKNTTTLEVPNNLRNIHRITSELNGNTKAIDSDAISVNSLKQLLPELEIIQKKKRPTKKPTVAHKTNEKSFQVRSNNHPSLKEPHVTIEKVKKRSEPLQPIIKWKREQISTQQYSDKKHWQTSASIKTEPAQNLSDTKILPSLPHNDTVELEEYINNDDVLNILDSKNSLQPSVHGIKQEVEDSASMLDNVCTISRSQIEKFRSMSEKFVKSEMTFKEASLATGIDEEILSCWMKSLEDILETNKEAVEKAKKYELLKRKMELMNQRVLELKACFANVMKASGPREYQEPNGSQDNRMDHGLRTLDRWCSELSEIIQL